MTKCVCSNLGRCSTTVSVQQSGRSSTTKARLQAQAAPNLEAVWKVHGEGVVAGGRSAIFIHVQIGHDRHGMPELLILAVLALEIGPQMLQG